jgi:hypothetical protein
MIVLDVDRFYASTMEWLKQYDNVYAEGEYQDKAGHCHNAIDDQVLAEILGLTNMPDGRTQ